MLHIAVIVYKDDPPLTNAPYMLLPIINGLQEAGHKISILNGPKDDAAADAAILHVDLTRVPADHLEFANRFPVAINGRVTDISKHRISCNLLQRGDGYDGQVVVKSNLNNGGRREGRLGARRFPERRLTHDMQNLLPWKYRTELRVTDYRIFSAASEVPDAVWINQSMVVEKFLPEMHDGYYCLRTWIFFGDREFNSLGYATCPIVKGGDIVRREEAEVPEQMRQMRRELGFDYGKFDYVVVDGQSILYDANLTPTLGNRSLTEYADRGRMLAKGLDVLL